MESMLFVILHALRISSCGLPFTDCPFHCFVAAGSTSWIGVPDFGTAA